ncbi:MAG: hypothetical protein CBC13_08180 [Planctomycetia bacterium TMED53]|nr:MAG: hypothetical protein CBC13_08180 [Planctomycetia bacterium TMED53]
MNRGGVSEMTPDHERFLSELSEKEKTLLILREELYEGSWQEMVLDLTARLQKGPQVFDLTETIEADLERIEELASYEKEHEINLGDFLEDES